VKFLIAGLGSIGRRHLRNLVGLGQRDILLYRTGKSTLPEDELIGFESETDLRAALERRPQAVIVSNPTALHLDVAIPAAQAGCHILLEKPVSHSLDRVDVLRRAVSDGGGQLLVGFHFRQHPSLRRVKALLEEGELGRVTSVRAHWGESLPEWHPWEEYATSYAARADLGGGALLTLSHPFDYLRWIFGDVVAARGVFGEALGLEVEAVVEASLRFQSGLLASVHLDYLQRPPQHRLEIQAENGRLRWDGFAGVLEISGPPAWKWEETPDLEGFDRNDLFVAEMEHFIQVAAGVTPPVCTLEDGIRVQEIIEQIRSSARSDGPGGTGE
jgi:predicted dehydrogenase